MDVEEFRFELNFALGNLKSRGKIKDFLIDGDDVTIVKHGANQAKEPRKSSFYSTNAGCEVSSDVVDGWEQLPEEMESY